MKKIFIFIALLSTLLFSKDTKDMTDEEFFKKIAELEKRQKQAKAKTKALKKLNKTTDKLLKTLETDK